METLALELDPFHLFLWDPFALDGFTFTIPGTDWHVTPFAINRVVVLMMLASLLCMLFFVVGSRRMALVPRGWQNLAETAYLFVRNNIAIDVIGPEGVKYANYLAALFFFIFFSNLLEIVPGINFPVTSRMAIPAFLALMTYLIFNIVGMAKQGPIRYFKDTLFPPGVPMAVKPLLALIELFSVFVIRPLTLAIRLLANMMAGHVLLTIFFLFTHDYLVDDINPAALPLGVLTLVVGAALIVFELLVISIQAYIFTMLTAFYIAESIEGHGAHDASVDTGHIEEVTPEHEIEGLKPQTA
ncbi:MAG: F0F1 ATP synthase subunit A [Actinomycetota bacterium]|nr:F0F1 ATP synthase subunit A [Actinomycetota bacterium]